MASPDINTDVQVKREAPEATPSFSQLATRSPSSPSSPTKRFRTAETNEQNEASKRQKVMGDVPMQMPTEVSDDDFAALLARATASTTQQIVAQNGQGGSAQQQQPPINALAVVEPQNEQNGIEYGKGFTTDPYLYMRILSLPILESLSTQILATFSQCPYAHLAKIISQPESEHGQAYATLKSLFDQTKQIYGQKQPFLNASELNITNPDHRTIISNTNLATFYTSIFGGSEVGFYELSDHFIEVFTPEGQPFGREPGEIFVNLKTQMYLSLASQEEPPSTQEDMLDDVFLNNVEEQLMARHPSVGLAASELDFLALYRERKQFLITAPSDATTIHNLSEQFSWSDFLISLGTYLGEAYKPMLPPYMKRHALTAPTPPIRPLPPSHTAIMASIENDITADTQRAIQATLASLNSKAGKGAPANQDSQLDPSSSSTPRKAQSPHRASRVPIPKDIPTPEEQSAPTQVLYQKARQAAKSSKSTPTSAKRGAGISGSRRPWSAQEESMLMAGLDMVKGPHWSQILQLYGPNGKVNQILADRNQVQLKDKARNLKLFFLKSGIEVPYYLKNVTGELTTRAPTQAARMEAEKARLGGDDEKARIDGIMVLAGGMHARGASGNGGHSSPTPSQSLYSGIGDESETGSLQIAP